MEWNILHTLVCKIDPWSFPFVLLEIHKYTTRGSCTTWFCNCHIGVRGSFAVQGFFKAQIWYLTTVFQKINTSNVNALIFRYSLSMSRNESSRADTSFPFVTYSSSVSTCNGLLVLAMVNPKILVTMDKLIMHFGFYASVLPCATNTQRHAQSHLWKFWNNQFNPRTLCHLRYHHANISTYNKRLGLKLLRLS